MGFKGELSSMSGGRRTAFLCDTYVLSGPRGNRFASLIGCHNDDCFYESKPEDMGRYDSKIQILNDGWTLWSTEGREHYYCPSCSIEVKKEFIKVKKYAICPIEHPILGEISTDQIIKMNGVELIECFILSKKCMKDYLEGSRYEWIPGLKVLGLKL